VGGDVKPLLFLDVDGVINACPPPEGAEVIVREGFRIGIQPWLRECLLRLHEHFEVVWMTTWREKAEPCFAEVLGLPGERPYVPWEHYKLPALRTYACDRPWAFVDDDAEWELRSLGLTRTMVGGFIVCPKVEEGLTVKQTDMLVAYAEALDVDTDPRI
jgi:hypothetical protein